MAQAGSLDPPLLTLAKERFGPELGEAERRIVTAAAGGESADLGSGDPACGSAWPRERVVGAGFLRWLLASPEARPHIDFLGVHISGARVDGELGLAGAEIDARVSLHRCALDSVWLEDARVRTFSLGGSHCARVNARRLHVRGSLYLTTRENVRFTTTGTVNLDGVKVDGELNCAGARLEMTRGERGALRLQDAQISGWAILDAGFEARGRVVLRGARIGGSLNCTGGVFSSDRGPALDADAIEVAHSVLLDERFSADGSVLLTDADIGHNLHCFGGSFAGRGRVAFNASRIKVAGDAVFGGRGTAMLGRIVLSDAKIGGSLRLSESSAAPRLAVERAHVGTDLAVEDVQFAAVGEPGLVATDSKIEGELRWSKATPAAGTQLDLRGTEVGTLFDGLQYWPESIGFKPRYEGLTYRRIREPPTTKEQVRQRIRWLGRERFSPQPYDQLAATLRASGHEDRSIEVAIAREDDRRKRGGLGLLGRVWSWLLKRVIGSGYRPKKALGWSVGFIAVGAFVFALAANDNQFVRTTTAKVPPFNAVVYSLDTFLPITDLQQERFHAPSGRGFSGGAVRIYFWLHVLSGWILVTLGVLGLTGLVRRE